MTGSTLCLPLLNRCRTGQTGCMAVHELDVGIWENYGVLTTPPWPVVISCSTHDFSEGPFSHHWNNGTTACSMTSAAYPTRPENTLRRCGCNLRTNSMQTPKLDPPPRIAQKRSGFSVALAVKTDPLAMTTVAWKRYVVRHNEQ